MIVNSYLDGIVVWWLLWNVFVLIKIKMSVLRCFFKKGRENMVLIEVYEIKVNGFWFEYKWVKYLE